MVLLAGEDDKSHVRSKLVPNESVLDAIGCRCKVPQMKMTSAICLPFAIILSATLQADDYFPPPDSEGGWRTLKTAEEIRDKAGMDLVKLERTWDFTQRCSQNTGLLIVRHGYLVLEKYAGRASRTVNPDMASTG